MRKETNYYCRKCKHRHYLTSRIGWSHYWRIGIPVNPTDWKHYNHSGVLV